MLVECATDMLLEHEFLTLHYFLQFLLLWDAHFHPEITALINVRQDEALFNVGLVKRRSEAK